VRTIAKVPLRRGEVDTEFDQEMLAELLDQLPFNLAIADLYKTRFNNVPGVVYAAGVRHAYNVAEAFREVGLKAEGVSGETPKRELALILARYERGEIDVLVNAQLLAEGWNSPRATVCMHLAPTASKRIYQQRVGRVTRRHPGKEAGIVVDFVHPATKHDDPVVTLHSLLDRDVYRGGAIVVGPVRRGRGRRLRVERRVLPVTADENRRIEVFERELWRIAVEHLDYGEQVQWAALAGARVAPAGWRRARAMLHFDQGGELKRTFLITAVDRNKNAQLRLRALQEIAASKDAEAFDRALDFVESWPREDKREGVKTVLLALAEKQIGRRDQANNWIWRCANMTREVHEEYAVQRWPETKRLLGLLVNSSGGAHARNARRLVHAARQQDRRLSAALLAAAIPHTSEAGEVINGARMRMSRKPAALARELLRNFPKGKSSRRSGGRRRKRKGQVEAVAPEVLAATAAEALEAGDGAEAVEVAEAVADEQPKPKPRARRSQRKPTTESDSPLMAAAAAVEAAVTGAVPAEDEAPKKPTRRRVMIEDDEPTPEKPKRRRTPGKAASAEAAEAGAEKPKRRRATRKVAETAEAAEAVEAVEAVAKPKRRRATKQADEAAEPVEAAAKPAPRRRATKAATADAAKAVEAAAKPARRRTAKPAAEAEVPAAEATAGVEETAAAAVKATTRRRRTVKSVAAEAGAEPKPAPRRRTTKKAAEEPVADEAATAVKSASTRRRATKTAADPPAKPAPRRRAPAKPKDPQPVAADEAA
jgi:hypothetical protein